jgi:polyphosphate kinase
VCEDVSDIFNYLTGYSKRKEYRRLLVAPVGLRSGMLALIEREMDHARQGRPAHIIVKNNAITDPAMVRALYRASRAGVEVDLIVRGVCCLKPGIPGISDRIRVRSVVGRFLEHSRVYWFANAGQPEVYIGSADLMERNLDRRVETVCRIRDTALAEQIRTTVLEAYLQDTERAYLLDGVHYRPPDAGAGPHVNAQDALLAWYTAAPLQDRAGTDTQDETHN